MTLKIVPNRCVNISVIMSCMFPTFIFSLLYTTMDYSSPARCAAVLVVFDVGGSRVGESDAWNINRKKSVCEIDQHFSVSELAASHKQWWCYSIKASPGKFCYVKI